MSDIQFCKAQARAVKAKKRLIGNQFFEHPHLDDGYAVTSYSSQGQTADRVLVHGDTE
jgi:ATP-dependent exoDNAse (exonuclease V) alpha subunit